MSHRCMSIDAIISSDTNSHYSSPPSKHQDQLLSPPNSTIGAPNSPPPSPVFSEASHDQYYNHHYDNHHQQHQFKSHLLPVTSSVSLDERRHRNKIASAKYRAKKQASMKAMAAKLAQMSAENATLQQELTKAHEDNEVLRNLCKSLMPSSPQSVSTS